MFDAGDRPTNAQMLCKGTRQQVDFILIRTRDKKIGSTSNGRLKNLASVHEPVTVLTSTVSSSATMRSAREPRSF